MKHLFKYLCVYYTGKDGGEPWKITISSELNMIERKSVSDTDWLRNSSISHETSMALFHFFIFFLNKNLFLIVSFKHGHSWSFLQRVGQEHWASEDKYLVNNEREREKPSTMFCDSEIVLTLAKWESMYPSYLSQYLLSTHWLMEKAYKGKWLLGKFRNGQEIWMPHMSSMWAQQGRVEMETRIQGSMEQWNSGTSSLSSIC